MLKDRIVIVTGAFGALGRVTARTLVAQGAKVALADAAPAAPADVASEFAGQLVLPAVDLSNAQAAQAMVAKVVARHGALDAVVNVAGTFRYAADTRARLGGSRPSRLRGRCGRADDRRGRGAAA